jgi:aconitate hydratase
LTGREIFSVERLEQPGQTLTVTAGGEGGQKRFQVMARLDTAVELEYYRNGGILHTVLRNI